MDITTFGAFTTARLGIYAAQKALNVTGNNIANINTTGYTRQAVDQVSLRVGATNHYASANGGVTGSGVLVTGMSQFRDPYLDIRYRNENSSVGAMDAKLGGLEELSNILDEVGKGDEGEEGEGILAAQFQDLRDQLANLTGDQSTEDEFLTLARSSADSLVKLLNNYAQRLGEVEENQANGLQKDVSTVNDILKNIQTLNENIQKSEIYGDSALELRDQRNLQLDELSQYLKIDVTYEPVSVGAGKTVDKLVIKTSGDNPVTLVDGNYAGQLTLGDGKQKNPNYDPSAAATGTNLPYLDANGSPAAEADAAALPYALTISVLTNRNGAALAGSADYQFSDTELYGSLQASRELLTESGEFTSKAMAAADADATTKRGIPYYQNALDSLAQKFAEVMNAANTGYLTDTKGNIIKSGSDPVEIVATKTADGKYQYTTGGTTTTYDTLAALEVGQTDFSTNYKLGGNLFSNSTNGDTASGITAANISISKSWSTDASFLQNSFEALEGKSSVGSSDNANILHIIAQFDAKQDYKPGDTVTDALDGATKFFSGSFEEMFTNIEETLATDTKSTTTLLNNYSVSATALDTSRESVSGVDLNDEAMNMMQYQKSYAAACRLMTTLDEVLDKLINGTGTVGR
ncbi:MAG: flagellar basal body rod C-terminal domain-containing protein [Oscillibacter sp.]|nr:flagellar basal body rod C-terminal domain-containing protein [Oscillibacter sp.]